MSYLNFPNSCEAEDTVLSGTYTQSWVGMWQKSHRSIVVIIRIKMVSGLRNTPKNNEKNTLFNKENDALKVKKYSSMIRVARSQAELDPAEEIIPEQTRGYAVVELSSFCTFKK